MTNVFEKFGIEHLSPSSANLFVAQPAAWLISYVYKQKSQVGAAAHRGTSVESGIVHALLNPTSPLDEAVSVAKRQFDTLTALSTDPALEKEANAIADMVRMGYNELRGYGVPSSTQGVVNYKFDDLAVPFMGYYDLDWEEHGCLTDIKTTHALPSSIKVNHARQVALYKAATGDNRDARVTYVTSKKSATYSLENSREHLNSLRLIGLTIQRFLSISDDPEELCGLVIPDLESFYYKDAVTRQTVLEKWGI